MEMGTVDACSLWASGDWGGGALLVRVRLHGLQAGQDGRLAALQQVDAHEDVAVAAESAPVRIVHLAPLGPVLHDERQLHQAPVDGAVVGQQLGVDECHRVVEGHIHLHRCTVISDTVSRAGARCATQSTIMRCRIVLDSVQIQSKSDTLRLEGKRIGEGVWPISMIHVYTLMHTFLHFR